MRIRDETKTAGGKRSEKVGNYNPNNSFISSVFYDVASLASCYRRWNSHHFNMLLARDRVVLHSCLI